MLCSRPGSDYHAMTFTPGPGVARYPSQDASPWPEAFLSGRHNLLEQELRPEL